MKTLSARGPRTPQLDDDQVVSEELVGRLLRAGETTVLDLLERFTPYERANLAMFCYRKAHLHRIGLAIAATCDEDTLVAACGTSLGQAIFRQSCELGAEPLRVANPHRMKITLAQRLPFDMAAYEAAQLEAEETDTNAERAA